MVMPLTAIDSTLPGELLLRIPLGAPGHPCRSSTERGADGEVLHCGHPSSHRVQDHPESDRRALLHAVLVMRKKSTWAKLTAADKKHLMSGPSLCPMNGGSTLAILSNNTDWGEGQDSYLSVLRSLGEPIEGVPEGTRSCRCTGVCQDFLGAHLRKMAKNKADLELKEKEKEKEKEARAEKEKEKARVKEGKRQRAEVESASAAKTKAMRELAAAAGRVPRQTGRVGTSRGDAAPARHQAVEEESFYYRDHEQDKDGTLGPDIHQSRLMQLCEKRFNEQERLRVEGGYHAHGLDQLRATLCVVTTSEVAKLALEIQNASCSGCLPNTGCHEMQGDVQTMLSVVQQNAENPQVYPLRQCDVPPRTRCMP